MPRFGLRAIDMAAPAILPSTPFLPSEPAVSAQTAKTSTCYASIRGAPGRRFSSAPHPPKQGEPIVNHLRSFLEAAVVRPPSETQQPAFSLGMHLKDGAAKRLEWKALEAEISRAEAVTSQTRSGLSPRARQRYLLDLRGSLSRAVYDLLKDERCEDKDMRSYVSDILVWADSQNARKAIAQEAIAAYIQKFRFKPEESYRYPIIILATEKAGLHSAQEPCGMPKQRNTGDHVLFLESWREAVTGEAEVLTVVGDSAASMKDSLEAVLEGSDHHWVSAPILIVFYASHDSVITANLSSIRHLCDANDINLCVDGPGLAFLAQAARPSDPNECLQNADILLTNPGSWFGFDDCAFISIHSQPPSSPFRNSAYVRVPQVTTITTKIHREDQRQENAVACVTKLWTVISQIGVPRIREKVDEVTHRAEALIYQMRNLRSLTTSYEGVGCVVRFSYQLSTSERGFSKIEEAEILSAINRSLYEFASNEAKEVQVFLVVVENTSVLQFSPLRLLNAGTFWVPNDDQIRRFSFALRQKAEFYHFCRTGALVFMERVSLCSDIEPLEDSEVTEDVLHWYAGFRVVPYEWQDTWINSSSGRHIVTTLTKMLVSELSDSFVTLVMNSPSLQQLLESCSSDIRDASKAISSKNIGRQRISNPFNKFLRGVSGTKNSLDQTIVDLPFSFYIHYDDATFNAPFVSVEPRAKYPINSASRHACAAAEIIVAVLQVVLQRYRKGNNIESLDHNLPDRSPERRETAVPPELSKKSEIDQPDHQEAQAIHESTLEESEVTSTDANGIEGDGFVSASSTPAGGGELNSDKPRGFGNRKETHPHRCETQRQEEGQDDVENSCESVVEDVMKEGISRTGSPHISLSETQTHLSNDTRSRISWLGLVTTEHLSSDADSEGSDEEYLGDDDDEGTLNEEDDSSLPEDGSDYQDTDSSNHSSENESSDIQSSEDSTEEGYSDNEESEEESETSCSGSDSQSDHETPVLEAIHNSKTEAETVPELMNENASRSIWLPAWFGDRWIKRTSQELAPNVLDTKLRQTNDETILSRIEARRHRAPHRREMTTVACLSTETDESESTISSDTNQSSTTQCSDESNPQISNQTNNRRKENVGKPSRASTTLRPWGWWKQKPNTSSESDGTSDSWEGRRDRRRVDNVSSSSSYDHSNAPSVHSSEYSSSNSQNSDGGSESENETNQAASESSSSSANYSDNLSGTEREFRSYWLPFLGYYMSSNHRNSSNDEGVPPVSNRHRSPNRHKRY
eukprot:gb/GEZJ01001287.1/.p1 GENE.gb/GEZJ01001287.1/~~gb/GEZJ01001287.1/.p1  ORF type:complete len:1260 (-),score=191.45 gb/GEZJ01001287.1/:557-4336(-)